MNWISSLENFSQSITRLITVRARQLPALLISITNRRWVASIINRFAGKKTLLRPIRARDLEWSVRWWKLGKNFTADRNKSSTRTEQRQLKFFFYNLMDLSYGRKGNGAFYSSENLMNQSAEFIRQTVEGSQVSGIW